jgi:sugar (pentulose or hexulose) kinase
VVWIGRHPVGERGVVESNGGAAGFGWEWLAQRLVGQVSGLEGDAAYAHAERLAASATPGADEALVFSGGAAVMNVSRPATFLAQTHALLWPVEVLQPDLGAPEVVRAALEAVAHSARANAEQVEALTGHSDRLVVAGGMARIRLLLRMVAALTDRVVHTPRVLDATVVGAAACAAVAAGLHDDLEAASAALAGMGAEVEPEADLVPVYAAAHRHWRALYSRLESL